jgi:hypothetical protein
MKVSVEQLSGMVGRRSHNMKLSDYVAQKSVEHGVKHVLIVTGGGAMHLNHSLGRHKRLSAQHRCETGRFS